MNKLVCTVFIIVFLFKTQTVFSNNLIYDVNNVEVKGKINNSSDKKKLIDLAFKKAFIIFVNKALLEKDATSLYKTETKVIKDLILTYQIIKNKKKTTSEAFTTFNIQFDSKKINNFLSSKSISYVDISSISLTIFPILIEDSNIFLYEQNFFYKNWVKLKETTTNSNEELISYNLALENIEDLEYVNNIKDNLNLIDIKKINSFNKNENYIVLIIYSTGNQLKAFIKTFIEKKSIDKNIFLNFNINNKEKTYKKTIAVLKKEIEQIWKEQNLVDVNTPTFLDFFLEINEIQDYLKLKSVLDSIDIIEKYSVLEMTSKYFKVRIKYKGKITKIKKKISEQSIDIKIVDNIWKLKIK